MRHSYAVLAMLLAAGCSLAERPPTDNLEGRGRKGAVKDQPAQSAQSAQAKPKPQTQRADLARPHPEQKPEVQEETPEQEKPERDLSAELLRAVGSPTNCLETREQNSAAGNISVSLVAHFSPAGMVTRGYAGGGGLKPSELDCIKRRVEGVRLPGPIEGAPKSVMANLIFVLQKPAPK